MRSKTAQNQSDTFTERVIGLDKASDAAKEWWHQLEGLNQGREDLVMKLVSELISRSATVEDFFLACSYSGREGVGENLEFLDKISQDRTPMDEDADSLARATSLSIEAVSKSDLFGEYSEEELDNVISIDDLDDDDEPFLH